MARIAFFESDVFGFAQRLAFAHGALKGEARLPSKQGDFELHVEFGDRGDVKLSGHLQPNSSDPTKLSFEIESDQSYLNATLLALRTAGYPPGETLDSSFEECS